MIDPEVKNIVKQRRNQLADAFNGMSLTDASNSGPALIAGLNKTLVWGLLAGFGIWWFLLRPKRAGIRT